MKILHTSDIHIDSPLTTRLPADKVRERRRELLMNFPELLAEAKRVGASAVIIAGDLFDSEKISKRSLDTALDAIERAKDVTVFYLPGNHEGAALQASGREMPKNLMIFGKEWTYFTLGDVTFAGRSEIDKNMFDSLNLPRVGKNIVVLHGELTDRCAEPDSIGLKDAAGRNIDYLALGHYHTYSREVIDDRGIAVYCGTPEGRGFDEIGEKGVIIIDTEGTRIESGFRKFAKRRLHIVQIDLTGATRTSEIAERAEVCLKPFPAEDMIRAELCGKYTPGLWKDTDGLIRRYSDRFYYFEVKDSSKIAINPDDYKNDKSLKGEFIRLVSADDSLDADTREKIIVCGINALMGEEFLGE